jgi:hypothetical protein
MTPTKKLLILAGLVLVAFGAAASSATAASGILIRPGEIFSQRSLGEITFVGGGVTLTCRLTMAPQFSRVLVLIEQQIGHLEGFFKNCATGSIEGFLNLPWAITINKINDLAPTSVPPESATTTIVSMRGAAINFLLFGRSVGCLYGSAAAVLTVRAPVTRTGAAKEYTWGLLTIRESARPTEAKYALARGEATCPTEVTVRGSFEAPRLEAQTITLL